MKYILLIIFVFFLNGCKKESATNQNIIVTPNVIKKGNTSNEFEYKLKNEPKIFLKFWSGMNIDEFLDVKKILVKENVLKGPGYIFGGYITVKCYPANMNPIFENGKLISIEIEGDECLYSLFKEKYKLPPLIERRYFKMNLNNAGKPGAKSDTRQYKELVLPQHKPFTYEEGEIIIKQNAVIRIEQEMHRFFRVTRISNKNTDFSRNNFSPTSSLGNIIITYMSKEQFLKEDEEMKNAIKLFNNKNLENLKREEIAKDEI